MSMDNDQRDIRRALRPKLGPAGRVRQMLKCLYPQFRRWTLAGLWELVLDTLNGSGALPGRVLGNLAQSRIGLAGDLVVAPNNASDSLSPFSFGPPAGVHRKQV